MRGLQDTTSNSKSYKKLFKINSNKGYMKMRAKTHNPLHL